MQKKLYQFANEEEPISFDYEKALDRFVHSDELKEKWKKEEELSLRNVIWGSNKSIPGIYIVQEGDNLWKIARINKVDIDELLKVNNFDMEEKIFPGTEIIIPENH